MDQVDFEDSLNDTKSLLKEVVQMGLRFSVSSVEGKMTSLNPAQKKITVSGKRTVKRN